MGDVLVYVDSAINGRLIAFARPLADATGGALVALVAGSAPVDTTALLGADVVLEVTHPSLEPYVPEAHQAVLVAAIAERCPEIVLVENATAGYEAAAAAAALAGLPFVGSCLGVSAAGGEAQSTSALYGGQLEASVTTQLPAVFAVNSSALRDTPASAGTPEHAVLAPPAALDTLRTRFLEVVEATDEGVDLESADMIVCIGRGIGGADNVELAAELAEALGAELAASRPVIDSGWVPKAWQIGKSGASVTPKLYLGVSGVSGAPEHLEGMQGAELIVAINTDPGAAILNVAHYGAVADLFDVADELTTLLG